MYLRLLMIVQSLGVCRFGLAWPASTFQLYSRTLYGDLARVFKVLKLETAIFSYPTCSPLMLGTCLLCALGLLASKSTHTFTKLGVWKQLEGNIADGPEARSVQMQSSVSSVILILPDSAVRMCSLWTSQSLFALGSVSPSDPTSPGVKHSQHAALEATSSRHDHIAQYIRLLGSHHLTQIRIWYLHSIFWHPSDICGFLSGKGFWSLQLTFWIRSISYRNHAWKPLKDAVANAKRDITIWAGCCSNYSNHPPNRARTLAHFNWRIIWPFSLRRNETETCWEKLRQASREHSTGPSSVSYVPLPKQMLTPVAAWKKSSLGPWGPLSNLGTPQASMSLNIEFLQETKPFEWNCTQSITIATWENSLATSKSGLQWHNHRKLLAISTESPGKGH